MGGGGYSQGGAMQQPGHMGNQWRGDLSGPPPMKMPGASYGYTAPFGVMGQPGHIGGGWPGDLSGGSRTGGMESPMGGGRMYAGGSPGQGMAGQGMLQDALAKSGGSYSQNLTSGYQPQATDRMYAGGSPNQGMAGRPYQWGPVQRPGGGWYEDAPMAKPAPKQPAADPLANFRSLMQQDPHAASEALNFNPAFMMQNMGALSQMVPGGDFGQWRNQYGASTSNTGPITDAQRALIRQRMGW